MTLYGFKDRSTAENLKQFGETMNFQRGKNVARKTGREVRIAKVDATIAAVANDEWESGTAVIIERKQDGTKVETNYGVMLYNTTDEDLVADQEVTIIRQGEKWITVTGAAGGGGGTQATHTIVANSGITASTWPTAGTGTGDIYELSSGGASWSSVGGGSVDVRNPWEESIDSGSVMICYKEGDYYVVIQASCPSV